MKTLKTTLFALLLVTITSLAFGQGQIGFYYTDDDGNGTPPPLKSECTAGTPLADGTLVKIFWDRTGNGPDVTDVQPAIGIGYGKANQTTFQLNGTQYGLGAGYFVTEFYFFVAELPTAASFPGDTALYYLKISTPNLCYQTHDILLAPGQQDLYLLDTDWTCTTGAPCRPDTTTPPAAPSALVASNGGCEEVQLTWNHNGQRLVGFNIYEDGQRVAGAQAEERETTVFSTTDTPHMYTIKAFNGGGESPASNQDNGDAYLLRFVRDGRQSDGRQPARLDAHDSLPASQRGVPVRRQVVPVRFDGQCAARPAGDL